MKLRYLILPRLVAFAVLAGYLAFQFIARNQPVGERFPYVLDHYLTDNAAREARRGELVQVKHTDVWMPFYGELTEAERRQIFERTKALGDLDLVRYVQDRGLQPAVDPSPREVIGHAEDIEARLSAVATRVEDAASPEDRRAALLHQDEIKLRVKNLAGRYRETISLYRDGPPERITYGAFNRTPLGPGGLSSRSEAYFKWRAEGGGFHRFLCWATHGIRCSVLDRPWSEVEQQMRQLGAVQVDARPLFRYQLSKTGWIGRDGLQHEWYYEFYVDRRDARVVANAKPGFVNLARSGLSVEPNESYASFLTRDVYPPGSVLDRALRLEAVEAAAEDYPVLKKIEVSYDVIRDHNFDQQFQGFLVMVTLGGAAKNDREGKRLIFTVRSGLDGACDSDGQPLEPDHEPRDLLGAFQDWGENGWQH